MLSQAVEISNQNLLDNTLKMSEIMDLLGLHIGAFEYSPGGYGVQVTKQIFPLMELPCEDENHLYVDEKIFLSRLSDMQRCPVPEGKRNLQNQRKNRALGTDYPVSAPRPFPGNH